MAGIVKNLDDKSLTPAEISEATKLAENFSPAVIPGANDAESELKTLLSYLETARSNIAMLEDKDATLRSNQSFLRRMLQR